ncbi:MAG: glycoside hydrolase family 99-like domain-containing protein [Candidatus Aminicenantia bacterium]
MKKGRPIIAEIIFLVILSEAITYSEDEITVGAFYYPWWRPQFFTYTVAKPTIWFLKEKERIIEFRRSPIEIVRNILIFGKYDTSRPEVAKNHIEQAMKGGIDVFALEWTGPYPTTVPNVNFTELDIEKGFLPVLKNYPSFKFCIFYDQAIRMFWKHGLFGEEAFNLDNPKVRETFLSDIFYISSKYFGHPNYFKVNNKPVLWLYLTRLYKGDVERVFSIIRENFRGNLYIIADELFNTIPINDKKIKFFNAVGCYGNGIDGNSFRDGANSREVVDISMPFYEYWKSRVESLTNIEGEKIRFIYPLQPQFDDDHLPGRPTFGEFYCDSPEDFQYVCEKTKSMMPENGILFVTSFNEWYETTAVEECTTPSMPFRYNWNDSFLEILKKVFKSN